MTTGSKLAYAVVVSATEILRRLGLLSMDGNSRQCYQLLKAEAAPRILFVPRDLAVRSHRNVHGSTRHFFNNCLVFVIDNILDYSIGLFMNPLAF